MLYKLNKNPTKGATIIEFSIVALLFATFIFATIDITRFFYIESILDKTAQKVLNYAQKVQYLDIDTRTIKIDTPEYRIFVNNYAKSINTGLRILNISPLQTKDKHSSIPTLYRYTTMLRFKNGYISPLKSIFDNSFVMGNISLMKDVPKVRIALLRPGDSVCREANETGECKVWIDHPDYCSEKSSNLCKTLPIKETAKGEPKPLYNYQEILESHPFHVIIEADFKPILPLLPFKLKAKGKAVGFREFVTFSSVPTSDLEYIDLDDPDTLYDIDYTNSAGGSIIKPGDGPTFRGPHFGGI